jgi:NAD(P)-dependent dehydrogenase (short-subunit alcohol dehydrogenase family)
MSGDVMTRDQLFGLGGKVAAVIGAGSGIGAAVALGCARQGATVRCLDVDTGAAERTAETIVGADGAAPLVESVLAHLANLPDRHRDPFDRMLICQAIEHDLTLVSSDRAIHAYPVRVLWTGSQIG